MTTYWYENQLRMYQTVLREIDVKDYDVEGVVAYLKKIDANCFVISGGGVVDFFHHDLFSANPNRFMEKESILSKVVKACHENDIKVVIRLDFRGVDKEIYDRYPDRFAVDENGGPVFWGSPSIPKPVYAPCYQSYYRNEHVQHFIRNVLDKFDVDGVWENAYSQDGICYCRTCQEQYQKDLQKELPRGNDDYNSSFFDEYRQWKAKKVKRHFRESRSLVKSYGEDKAFCVEVFGLFYDHFKSRSQDLFDIRDDFDFLVTPLFSANHEPLNAPSTLIKFLKSLAPKKTPVMLFGHLGTNNELRYISSSAKETRIWLWEAISAGGSLWDAMFMGQHGEATYDRRNALLTADIHCYMKKHEASLHQQEAVQDVSILYSRETNNLFGHTNREKDNYVTHIIGMEQVLIRENISYSFLLANDMTKEDLAKVSVLVLPNAACLPEEKLSLIRQYVQNGGKLLATYETSLYDEYGIKKNNFGLSDVFGVSYTGIKKDASNYGYQLVKEAHPLTEGLEDTELIANWGQNLLVRSNEDAKIETPLSYVPKIFPQPPEKAYLLSLQTDYPTAVAHHFGKGEVIFLPGEWDRYVWMHGHADFSIVIANALNDLVGDNRSIVTDAPESLHVTLNKNKTSGDYLLHGINRTSTPSRPVREILPLYNTTITLYLPGDELVDYEVLWGDETYKVVREEKLDNHLIKITCHFPKIEEYVSIRIRTSNKDD